VVFIPLTHALVVLFLLIVTLTSIIFTWAIYILILVEGFLYVDLTPLSLNTFCISMSFGQFVYLCAITP
jgi:hypothetical protein